LHLAPTETFIAYFVFRVLELGFEPVDAEAFRRSGREHRIAEVGVPEMEVHHRRTLLVGQEVHLVTDPCIGR
jgi:hypothetical protein